VQYLLEGRIRDLSCKLWTKAKKIENGDVSALLPLLENALETISSISWRNKATEDALVEAAVAVDVLRVLGLFSMFASHFHGEASTMDDVESACLNALDASRSEKNLEDILNSMSYLISSLSIQIENGDDSVISYAKYLIKVMRMLTKLCVSYSNKKKLFVLGTDALLSPFMECVYTIRIVGVKGLESLEDAMMSLVGKCLFDDPHNVDEVARISLDSLLFSGAKDDEQHGSAVVKKRKHAAVGGAKEVSGKSRRGKVEASPRGSQVFSYHASFYSVVALWVQTKSSEGNVDSVHAPEQVAAAMGAALGVLVDVFLGVSRALALTAPPNETGSSALSSFAVRWRLHVKRLLHIGVGLIQSISPPLPASQGVVPDSAYQTPFAHYMLLMSWNALIGCMNRGLAGDVGGTGGTIPNHASLEPYVDKMKTMAGASVSRATSALLSLRDLMAARGTGNEENEDSLAEKCRVVSGHILFMRSLMELECRVVSDKVLPLVLRNLSVACDCLVSGNSHRPKKVSSLETMDYLKSECKEMFLTVIRLYGELRQLDSLLSAVLDEARSGPSDRSFSTVLLGDDSVRSALGKLFGGMPHGQRHSCWEAIYNVVLMEQAEQLPVSKGLCGTTYIHCFCALLESLGLSGELDMPVPPRVLLVFFAQTQQIVRAELLLVQSGAIEDHSSTLTAAIATESILVRIATNFMSSCAYSPSIPPYPYEMKVPGDLSKTPDEFSAIVKTEPPDSSEYLWTAVCAVASGFIVEAEDGISSEIKDMFSVSWGGLEVNKRSQECILIELIKLVQKEGVKKALVGEEFCGALTDYVFRCYSLFAVVSVELSPVLKFCEPTDEMSGEDIEENQGYVNYGDLIQGAYDKLHREVLFKALELLTSPFADNQKLIVLYPSLGSVLVSFLPVWGTAVGGLDHEVRSFIQCICMLY
jgi:hypothetical protein